MRLCRKTCEGQSNRTKLRSGDKVEMIEDAVKMGLDGRKKSRTGTVVLISVLNPDYIRIRRTGLKQTETWASKFWRRISY